MPPGTDAPEPPPRNPTTSNVRPGTITNRGQPYWVRSTPKSTMPRANRPTTTRTTPRAPLDPPPRGRGGRGIAVMGTGGGAASASGRAGSTGGSGDGSMLSVGACAPLDYAAAAASAAGASGSLTISGASGRLGSSALHLGAKMVGLPASTSALTCAMSSLGAASSGSAAGWSAPGVLPVPARFRLLMTPQLTCLQGPRLSLKNGASTDDLEHGVDGAVAAAKLEGLLDCRGDEPLRVVDRCERVAALGELGRYGRGEDAAAAVRVGSCDPRRLKLHELGAIEIVVDGKLLVGVAALDHR